MQNFNELVVIHGIWQEDDGLRWQNSKQWCCTWTV